MPVDYTRRSYPGAATSTTLSAGCGTTDTSLSVASTTGWPTSGGPFFVVIDPGLTQEEKCLISSVSGTTLTVSTRGADGTVAAAHASGATIYPCFTATDADTANAHYNDVADNHTQYLNTARHDVPARHTFGGAFPAPSTPPATGTSGNAGVAGGPARSDHSHAIGAGSVVAGSFAAGAIVDADISSSAAIRAAKLQNQFVTPGTYGDGTHSAQVTITQQGVVSLISQTPISFPTVPRTLQVTATPANWTQTALSTFVVVPGSTVTITNPGDKRNVSAVASGNMTTSVAGNIGGNIRVGISTDGGSTWTYGGAPQVAYGTSSIAQAAWTAECGVDGVTPTGNVQARIEILSSLGSASNHQAQNMTIVLKADPA